MAKLSGFLDYYFESMRGQLAPLEEERLLLAEKLKKTIFYLLLGAIALFVFLSKTLLASDPVAALGVSGGGAFVFYRWRYRVLTKSFTERFKEQIIEKMVGFLDPSLLYRPYGSISKSEYQLSQLFPKAYDRFFGDDLVEGEIEGVSLKFSDLHTQYKSKDKNGKEHWHTIFQGIFFVADFHKHFKGRTFVLPDRAEKLLGSLGHFFQGLSGRGELVKMDHPAFEKEFVVYSDDQVEARYLLSPVLMERILTLQQRSGKALHVSFFGSMIFIAIHYRKAMFEPNVFKSLLEFKEIREYFEVLDLVAGIVKEFKLNERLWSKV